jgi:hypothetical protein
MLAIGVGGADAVDALTGTPWELKAPEIVGKYSPMWIYSNSSPCRYSFEGKIEPLGLSQRFDSPFSWKAYRSGKSFSQLINQNLTSI